MRLTAHTLDEGVEIFLQRSKLAPMPGEPDPYNPSRKLYRYEGEEKPARPPRDVAVHLNDLTAHIQQHIGSTGSVFHEIVSTHAHIDVIIVPPNEKFLEWTLVTSGMSDKPMIPPGDKTQIRYAEVLLRLPKNWKMRGQDGNPEWKREENYWPIRLLKTIARFPHQYGAFLWVGHTLDNGQPATPWSEGTHYKGVFLAPSRSLPGSFENLQTSDGKTIKFLAIYPAYLEETALARKNGAKALCAKFVEHGVSDVIDVNRRNVVTGTAQTKSSFWDRLRGR